MLCSDICVISATRERPADEITPVSVEHSRSKDDNETDNAAEHAIDLNTLRFSLFPWISQFKIYVVEFFEARNILRENALIPIELWGGPNI